MASWTLVPCLVALRDEFNTIAPKRDKGADGSIGDSSHTSSSDHTPDEDSNVLRDHDADSKNEVHALDIDSTGPWPDGHSFKSMVLEVIEREKAKWDDPDDVCRLNYVIFDRKIYDKDNDFEPKTYTGSDPHTNHAHFSARYETQAENDTRPWGVVEEFGDTVSEQDVIAALQSSAGQAAIYSAINPSKIRKYNDDGTPVPEAPDGSHLMTRSSALSFADKYLNMLESGNAKGMKDLMAAIKAVGSVDLEALAAMIVSGLVEVMPPGGLTEAQITEAVKRAFREGHRQAPGTGVGL